MTGGGAGMQGRQTVYRLLMIACTVWGVLWMHTFGHADGHDRAMPSTAVTVHGQVAAHAILITALPTIVDDLRVGSAMGMDPFSVCLAVLTAIGLAIMLAVWAASRRRISLAGNQRAAADVAMAGRGPPGRPLGLYLADLSVLRI